MKYIILNKFVYYTVKSNKLFFFDTLLKKHFLFEGKILASIFQNLTNPYVVELNKKTQNNREVLSFVTVIEENNMGYISNKEEFVFYPIVRNSAVRRNDLVISELTLHLKYLQKKENNTLYPKCKQFLYPKKSLRDNQLSLKAINKVVNLIFNKHLKINVIVTQYFFINNIEDIICFFDNLKISVNFYLTIDSIQFINKYYRNHFLYHILIDNPEQIKIINKTLNKENVKYIFITSSEIDYHNYINNASIFKLSNFEVKPYFNGLNLKFFQENVFNDVEDIISQDQTIYTILEKKYFSSLLYGKMIMLPNGEIYTNMNANSLGNISLINKIHKSLLQENNQTWYLSRNNLTPCSYCLFSELCPPVSNYELAMKTNNLCNVYE